MTANTLIREANKVLKKAVTEVRKNQVSLPSSAVQQIIQLQQQVVQLRDTAIVLHRESGWTLEEIAVAFDISPARVSQISRHIAPNKTRRIRVKKSR